MSHDQRNFKKSPNTSLDQQALWHFQRQLVKAAATCAAYCEHVEHNEPAQIDEVVATATKICDEAATVATQDGEDLIQLYQSRIAAIERANVMRFVGDGAESLTGADSLGVARTWRDVQISQMLHDRQFHPDVFGLSKIDQLRHYTFHLTKLTGLVTEAIETGDWAAFKQARLADVAIFGIKIMSVCNARAPETSACEPLSEQVKSPLRVV